jgi:membrane protein
MGLLWRALKAAVSGFITNDALSRGASIAFYAATSLAPVLLIVVAIAGLAFGQDAARAAISDELGRLLGSTGGDFIKSVRRDQAIRRPVRPQPSSASSRCW